MAYIMKIGHWWVLEAKIGLTLTILAKNVSKMTIFDPFKSPQFQGTKFTLQILLKKSLVLMPLS